MLFNFEGPKGTSKKYGGVPESLANLWGCSSAGRAPALQAGGQEFDPLLISTNSLRRVRGTGKKDADRTRGLIAQVVRAHA